MIELETFELDLEQTLLALSPMIGVRVQASVGRDDSAFVGAAGVLRTTRGMRDGALLLSIDPGGMWFEFDEARFERGVSFMSREGEPVTVAILQVVFCDGLVITLECLPDP